MAYSDAKTSVIYLPQRLATLSYPKALMVLQQAHKYLHLAETYKKELREHAKWYPIPRIWSEEMYWQMYAINIMLQIHASTWSDHLSEADRLHLLWKAVDRVKTIYKREGKKWPWKRLSDEDRKNTIEISITELADAERKRTKEMLPNGTNSGVET